MKHAFVVYVDVPEGVSVPEVASHLADAHRAAVRSYDRSDPMSTMAEITVEGVEPTSEAEVSRALEAIVNAA